MLKAITFSELGSRLELDTGMVWQTAVDVVLQHSARRTLVAVSASRPRSCSPLDRMIDAAKSGERQLACSSPGLRTYTGAAPLYEGKRPLLWTEVVVDGVRLVMN